MAVVFTDAFTVGADTNINAYPAASPNNDYAYMRGSGGDLTVNAANDRVQVVGTADEYHARIVDAAVPTTGDMEITASVYSDASGSQSGELLLRCSASADTAYIAYLDLATANEVQIYRCVAGSLTLLASANNGLTGSAARTWVFRVEGSGATVTLTLTVAGGTPLVYNDTNAARLTSGGPGVGGYNGSANLVYIDSISVDDLAAGGVTVAPAATSMALTTVNPTFVAGSLSLAPTATSAALSVVNPAVVLGGDAVVAPTATQIALSVVNPTAIAGSLSLAPTATQLALSSTAPTVLPNALVGLRFFGTDTGSFPDVDRLRIPLRDGGSPTAADVGSGDFSYEIWLRCLYADNTSTSLTDWRFSNIVLDRDVWSNARGHGLGVARDGADLVAVFGVAGASLTHVTIAGSINIGDGNWHHVCVRRTQATGLIELVVDNTVDASGTYTTGDLSYDGSNTGGQDNDHIVIGTEKHDLGFGFAGDIDVIRISTIRRTLAAERPLAADSDTAVLYRLNEAVGTSVADGSSNGVTATIARGGPDNAPQWFVEAGVGTLISPAPSVLTLTIVNPTVTVGSPPITPTAVSLALSVVNPSVVHGSLSISPAAVLLALLVENPTVAIGSPPFTPAAVSLILSTENPTLVAGSLSVAPAATLLAILSVDPTVQLGSLSLSPAAAVLTLLSIDPTTVAGSIALAPAAATLTMLTIDPSIQAGSDTTVTPQATTVRLLAEDPGTVLGSQVIAPAAALLQLLSADPGVQFGSLIIGPDATVLTFSVVAPTTVAGSLALTPAATLLTLLTSNPSLVLSSMAVTPAATVLQLAVINPTVSGGSATPHAVLIYRPAAERTIYRAPAEVTIYRPKE